MMQDRQDSGISEVTKTTIRQHFSDVVNHGRLEKVQDLWAKKCIVKGFQGTTIKGPEEVKKRISDLRESVPDVKIRLQDILIENNKAVATWEMSGTLKRDFKGIKASGKKFKVRGADVFKLKNRKILEDSLYFDSLEMLTQLGAI